MFYAQALAILKRKLARLEVIPGDTCFSVYVGSFWSLFPYEEYNGSSLDDMRRLCGAFWEALDEAATYLGGRIARERGDLTDVFFCVDSQRPTPE